MSLEREHWKTEGVGARPERELPPTTWDKVARAIAFALLLVIATATWFVAAQVLPWWLLLILMGVLTIFCVQLGFRVRELRGAVATVKAELAALKAPTREAGPASGGAAPATPLGERPTDRPQHEGGPQDVGPGDG